MSCSVMSTVLSAHVAVVFDITLLVNRLYVLSGMSDVVLEFKGKCIILPLACKSS